MKKTLYILAGLNLLGFWCNYTNGTLKFILHSVLSGFGYGLGFLGALSIIIFLLLSAFAKRSVTSDKKKLTLELLEEYKEDLRKHERYEDMKDFQAYIDAFEKKESMDAFFEKYKLKSKIEFSNENSGEKESPFNFKVVYKIVLKNED